MTFTKILKTCIIATCLFLFTQLTHAQTGYVIINQDPDIKALLNLKKGMKEETTDRYKIQIYSGQRNVAEGALESFRKNYTGTSKLVYETPNYKVWVGSYRSRLEADRALIKIKSKYPSAFIFKPKK